MIIPTIWSINRKRNLLKSNELREAEAALLSINGMGCSICGLNVLGALFDLEGVFITEVIWAQGRATVAYNPAVVRSEDLLQAVATAGRGRWQYHAYLLSKMPAQAVLVR